MLLNVSKKQSGIYKCEATEELPTLETKYDVAPMTVVGKIYYYFSSILDRLNITLNKTYFHLE